MEASTWPVCCRSGE